MKVEEVNRPIVRGKYKHLVEQALALSPNRALYISGITLREANSIRQAGFRNGLRSQVRTESGGAIRAEGELYALFLYHKKDKGG